MKRKILGAAIIAVLLAGAALCIAMALGAFEGETQKIDIADGTNLKQLAAENRDSAFSFLERSSKSLPYNMRGYIVDPEKDIDLSSSDEAVLKAAVDKVFEGVDAMLPNTVVISFKETIVKGDLDIIEYLTKAAKQQDMTVILAVDGENFLSGRLSLSQDAISTATAYGADGILINGFFDRGSFTREEYSAAISEIKEALLSSSLKLGLGLSQAGTEAERASLASGEGDFYFVTISSAAKSGGQAAIEDWSAAALNSTAPLYGVLRNDLVRSGEGWSDANEISQQLRLLYNNGGFSGCVMADHEKLQSNDNETTINLYSYYEYFNNVDYTALTLTEFSLQDNSTLVIKGTSDGNFPVLVRSRENEKWTVIKGQGENGDFTAEISLSPGTNTPQIRHKNAYYTYNIDLAADIITSSSATVDNGTVTLSARAKKGASVWASLANTGAVELTPGAEDTGGYCDYSANYELKEGLAALTDDLVSFGAEYNGLYEYAMCGESPTPSPYSDNGLGTALMLRIDDDYTETNLAASEDDSSDPICTPQLSGTYGYVDSLSVIDNHGIYSLASGVKLHASNATLIIGGYVLPHNKVNLDSVTTDGGTSFALSFTYPSLIMTTLAPQEYTTGYLQRIYNVESFTAEYVDITFYHTALTDANTPELSASNIFSSCQWLSNADANTVTLRLFLKTAGKFSGYSFYKNDKGQTVFAFKNDVSDLNGTVIMLDPGHGGYGSPGAADSDSNYEKDITLSIAQKTAAILREHGATVILTRDSDEAVFLGERVAMLREKSPDFFVSIHCDGADSTSWLGTHTFYYKSYSMPLAKSIHEQLVKAYRSYYYTDSASSQYEDVDKGIKFFPYMVTRVEECPSVLVECGYLSNTQDAAFLNDENGQQILATAIAQGIVDCIGSY